MVNYNLISSKCGFERFTKMESIGPVWGVVQMSTLLNKSFLLKVFTKEEGGQKSLNSVHVVCSQPLVQ